MKQIIFSLGIVFIISDTASSQTSCLPCDQLGMSVNVGSDTNALSIYHSGQYLTHPQEYNLFTWYITDMTGNTIFQDTIVDNAFCNFSHNFPITDTMNVEVYLVNDSAMLSNGSSIHCLFQDQIYWETGIYPSGTPWGRWAFIHGNMGTTVTNIKDITDNLPFNIFPSPVQNELTIIGPDKPYSLSIYNIQGQLMRSYDHVVGQNTVSIMQFPAGLYSACLRVNNKTKVLRFIKN